MSRIVNGELRIFSEREKVALFVFLLTGLVLPFAIIILTH